jgi:UDP-N-acetylglucosamine/UDP-N-acetylgalactosamine diphosphorylase
MTADALRGAFTAADQAHVLRFLENAEGTARDALQAQLEEVDLELLAELRALIASPARDEVPVRFEPPDLFPLERGPELQGRVESALERGEELLAAGRVGYVLVAGGQASRLGYDGPKGAYPVGPVTGRSLFEVHARRLLRASRGGSVRVPWYVMTSRTNDAQTREIFEQNDYYGLAREDVFFFSQDMLPALDEAGRILFANPDSLFLAPNGHGGVLMGLRSSGAVDDMRARGLEQLSYFQVDNPMVRPADPLFLGLHALAGAGMSSKVVAKEDPAEKVGVIGRVNGALGCIEYSDLPEPLRAAREPDGRLRFRAGNIAVHVLAVDFLDELTRGRLELPWHVARKKMKTVDEQGAPVERTGFKFEMFVFDALARSQASVTLEVDRASEFSALKNAQGADSATSVRRDLCAMYASWVEAAGLALPAPDADGVHPVEVDPLLAETEAQFVALGGIEPHVHENGHLYT